MSREEPPLDIDLQLQFGDEGPPHPPVDDQRAVMASYFDDTGRVVVDASAGTGKTSTLVVTLAETVVRNAHVGRNPLDSILVTTFGRDATAELKTRLKELLRQHTNAGGRLPQAVFRWIETDSHIQTLDSFFVDLLREVAVEVGIPPEFTVDDRLELREIREGILDELRDTHRSEFRQLTRAYPPEAWREYPPDTVADLLVEAHQKCREFGFSVDEAADSFRESLHVGHGGESVDGPASVPPETLADVAAVLRAVVAPEAELSCDDPAAADQFLEHIRETYFETEAAIDAFTTLLAAFEEAYDRRTRRGGQFTFTDVASLLDDYLAGCDPTHPFRQSVRRRFDHVFVDEFQDTSTVQCAVLRRLLGDETDLFVIGDTKQAIYEWRSADPAIFAEIVAAAKAAAPEPASVPQLSVDDVRYHALTTGFRHHPDITAAANHVFQRLLEDPSRGAIGEHTPSYVPVASHDGLRTDGDRSTGGSGGSDDYSHVHVLNVDAATDRKLNTYLPKDVWATAEATRIAETIATITDPNAGEPPVTVRERDETGSLVQRRPTPGDVTLLFRSTRTMQRYATVLREDYGIPAETAASGDLFDQPEIELLIDVLSWLARPYATDTLRRLLRSPLVALADDTVRTVVAADCDLETLVDAWPDRLPADDRQRLAGFLRLRDDLRRDREESKPALIHRLLRHSGFDALVLSDADALRRHGNVWLLTEIVGDWEVDELLSYREFLRRLQLLRTEATGRDPQFSEAEVLAPDASDAVTLTTVHGAKGQEYPIVFLCDLIKQSSNPRLQTDRLLTSRRHGFALRPRPGSTPSPETVEFPTPDRKRQPPVWFNDSFDGVNFPDATGPIWVSDARSDTGEFRYPNPLNGHLAVREAEFWRLAYVAFTRAEDHVFLGLGPIADDERMRWTTWLAGFNETLEPDCGWDGVTDRPTADRLLERKLSWTTAAGTTHSSTIPVGVDEIPPASPTATEPLDLTAELHRLDGPGDRIESVPYRPLAVSATSLSTLADCPRAFQYRHINEIDPPEQSSRTADLSAPPAPTSTRDAFAPDEWGDIVHRLLELQLTAGDRASAFVQRQPEAAQSPLRTVTAAIDRSTILDHARSADHPEWVAEYDLTELVTVGDGELRATGTIDFLYRADGGWHLVDWKTGRRPTTEPDESHVRQLSVYAWLLARRFDIAVGSARLAYIEPDAEPTVMAVDVTADLDLDWVDRSLEAAGSVSIAPDGGLAARPAPETCAGCRYAANRGGPCQADWYQNQ